jgi:hypothetical protein
MRRGPPEVFLSMSHPLILNDAGKSRKEGELGIGRRLCWGYNESVFTHRLWALNVAAAILT